MRSDMGIDHMPACSLYIGTHVGIRGNHGGMVVKINVFLGVYLQ